MSRCLAPGRGPNGRVRGLSPAVAAGDRSVLAKRPHRVVSSDSPLYDRPVFQREQRGGRMNQKRWMPWVGAVCLVVALAVVVAGCGGGGGSNSSSNGGNSGTSAGTGTTGGSATGKKIKV